MTVFDAAVFDSAVFDTASSDPTDAGCYRLLEDGSFRILEDSSFRVVEVCPSDAPTEAGCYRITEDGSYRILEDGTSFRVVEICGVIPVTNDPNGNRPIYEYQPTYHELKERREIERKFEEAELNLKSTQIKIEDLEFKRLQDLADQAMQMELLQLLAQQHELTQLIEQLQQQKLRALMDDDEVMFLMTCLYN